MLLLDGNVNQDDTTAYLIKKQQIPQSGHFLYKVLTKGFIYQAVWRTNCLLLSLKVDEVLPAVFICMVCVPYLEASSPHVAPDAR